MLGKALKGHRDDVVIGTKFGMDMHGANGNDLGARGSRRYILKAVEASLRRLGTDWIDLYQFHTPDPQTPIEETLAALDVPSAAARSATSDTRTSQGGRSQRPSTLGGSLRGSLHFNPEPLQPAGPPRGARGSSGGRRLLAWRASLLPRQRLAHRQVLRRSCPEGSRLSHTRTNLVHDADWQQLGRFGQFAKERGITELQLAFSWLAAQPGVSSVIAGATRPEQIRENAEAVCWIPSRAEREELDEIFPRAPKVALF